MVVILEEDAVQLKETVVVGYVSQEKKTISSSVPTITIPDFNPTEHLVAPNKLPFMRFVALLGVCTNVQYDEASKN